MTGASLLAQDVARRVGRHAGLALPADGSDRLEGAVLRCMLGAGFTSEREYLAHLQRESGAMDDLVEELVVGETYFFRDQGQFAFIRNEIVPEILGRRGPDHVIRAWSAGCASGEEAYSLAILFDQEGLSGRAIVVGTDISRRALARARAARFGSWSFRGVDERIVEAYFSPDGEGGWKLADRIRSAVRFSYLNLAQDTYPSPALGLWGLDLVLCRNTLIYLDDVTVAQAFRRIWASLAAGGWLVIGASDPSPLTHAPFVPVITPDGLFYRRAETTGPLSRSRAGEAGLMWAPDALRQAPPPAPSAHPPLPTPLAHPPPSAPPPALADDGDTLAEARRAAQDGDFERVIDLTRSPEPLEGAWVLRVRATANLGRVREAARLAAQAVAAHPLSAELHILGAVLLLDLGRGEEAAQAVRKALYVDPCLAIGHFLHGRLLGNLGDAQGARRAYRNARALCSTLPPDALLPLGDGERAGPLAAAAAAELTLLEQAEEPAP